MVLAARRKRRPVGGHLWLFLNINRRKRPLTERRERRATNPCAVLPGREGQKNPNEKYFQKNIRRT